MARATLQADIQQTTVLPANLQLAALNMLRQLPDDDKLCHGDFHPDNIIVAPDGLVVVDWANAVCGHPLADVARTAYDAAVWAIAVSVPVVETLGRGASPHFIAQRISLSLFSNQILATAATAIVGSTIAARPFKRTDSG